jgi:hypothetical protein
MTFDPAIVLTAPGATITAGAITAVIQLFKSLLPDGWLANASALRKRQLAAVLAAAAVVYAAAATAYPLNLISIGGLGVAWFGITLIATAGYDAAKTTVQVAQAALGTPNAADAGL